MPEEKAASIHLPFQIDQKIVYPLQGVGQIKAVTERVFKGKATPYYQIYLQVTDMTVMIPVDKAEEIGIRAIVAQDLAREALDIISKDYEPITADWKMRYQMNLDHLKNGAITDIALVVRNLYHRSKIKELPILERKLYDNAMKLLIDEVAFSLDIPTSEVEQIIHDKLEPLAKKNAFVDEDEDDDLPKEFEDEVEAEDEDEDE